MMSAKPCKGWVRNLGLAATSSSGNSNSLNLNLNFETIFRSDERDFLLRANYLFAETSNKTSQNRFRANASHSWKFNKRTYAGINTNFAYDASTDLDYRMTPGVHAGYYPLLTDYGGLSFEGGLGYTFQQEGNIVNNASSFYLAQRLYWQIGYHTYITQEISYQAFLEDVTDFNISSYLFLDTFLTKDLSWRIGLQYFYDGTPPSGLKSSDLSLLSGISVTF